LQFYFSRARSATWAVRLRGDYRLRRLGNSSCILAVVGNCSDRGRFNKSCWNFSMTGPCYGTDHSLLTTKGNIIARTGLMMKKFGQRRIPSIPTVWASRLSPRTSRVLPANTYSRTASALSNFTLSSVTAITMPSCWSICRKRKFWSKPTAANVPTPVKSIRYSENLYQNIQKLKLDVGQIAASPAAKNRTLMTMINTDF